MTVTGDLQKCDEETICILQDANRVRYDYTLFTYIKSQS
ncbi:MAG: hypothetical protein CM1200mP28_17500 [Deltaproteobacteria bacterium]|nr:MAG: hypothetical protein CM1200mP28_17500 [Deltaproteobacteria bacterium]